MLEKLLPTNVHTFERVMRILLGVVLLAFVFVTPPIWWGLIGLVPLLTGVIGTCPLYTALRVTTCTVPARPRRHVRQS